MSTTAKPEPTKREWSAHMWLGCDVPAWWRLLWRNRFAVSPRLWYVAAIITLLSGFHSLMRFVQYVLYRRQLRRTEVREAPVFIIGHWRTGTTLLHELLILDPRHAFPTTYECIVPHHFLISECWLAPLVPFLLPSRRPMDNMAVGWGRPQEDEFALCMLGQPSPYLTIAFPNHPPQDQEAFDLEGLTPVARRRWKDAFLAFIRWLTLKHRKRLILKSPTHSCRIPTLLELFPDARFIHIVRDPYVVIPSTFNLWRALYETQGMQYPVRFEGLENHVYETFNLLYRKLDEGKRHVDPSRYCEVRYEELVRDPVGEMRKVYDRLGLGGFEEFLPQLEKYLAEHKDYRTNRFRLTPELRDEISSRCGDVIRQYGYDNSPALASA